MYVVSPLHLCVMPLALTFLVIVFTSVSILDHNEMFDSKNLMISSFSKIYQSVRAGKLGIRFTYAGLLDLIPAIEVCHIYSGCYLLKPSDAILSPCDLSFFLYS